MLKYASPPASVSDVVISQLLLLSTYRSLTFPCQATCTSEPTSAIVAADGLILYVATAVLKPTNAYVPVLSTLTACASMNCSGSATDCAMLAVPSSLILHN